MSFPLPEQSVAFIISVPAFFLFYQLTSSPSEFLYLLGI